MSVAAIGDNTGGTYTKLNWDGEEVQASLLCNGITTWNTREVDESWLDNALLAGNTLEDLLSKTKIRQLVRIKSDQ